MFRLLLKLYDKPDSLTPGGPSLTPPSDDKDDVIKFLEDDGASDEVLEIDVDSKSSKSKDKGEKEKPKDGKEKDKKKDKSGDEEVDDDTPDDDEDDELSEIEKELEEEGKEVDEDELQLITPVRRREILKEFPELFKKFPYLEHAYYRDRQFTEMFPTIKDAKDTVEKASALDRFEADLVGQGNTTNILKAIREENPDSFNTIVDNYLVALATVDRNAHDHVIGNVIKQTIVAMVREGNSSSNDPLKAAAQILNQFVFGSSEFSPPTRLSKEKKTEDNNRDEEFKRREQQFHQQAFRATYNDLNTKVTNTLKATVEQHIDPKGSMTEYIKTKAVSDCLTQVESLMRKDSRFKAITDRLWEKARDNDYDAETVGKIRSAYLSKARTLLPTVIKTARNAALRGMGKRVNEKDLDPTDKKGPVRGIGESRSHNSGKITKATDIPRGMSTLDFLNTD